jgi:hypothetical protein
MSLIWGLVALLAAAVVATCGVRAARRALAGGLIGEISETLTLLETHDLEAALAHCGEGGRAPSLPALSTLSYRAGVAWMALLGAHLARLSASFYASAQALQDELRGLSSETAEAARTERARSASQELQRTFTLGDEALRSLRDVVSRRRCRSISRS